MNISPRYYLGRVLTISILFTLLSTPASASVTYQFVVGEEPTGDFFKPLSAKIILSDEAVSSGMATKGQIESVVISGGPTMQEANRITLTYLHHDFKDLTINLSADRETVSSISAILDNNGTAIDKWVFFYQRPDHPTLNIHEFVVRIDQDSVDLETTILPIPPTTYYDSFKGQWHRATSCWICSCVNPFVSIEKICWLDWVVIGGGIIFIVFMTHYLRRRNLSDGE